MTTSEIKDILERYGLAASKRRGQNFLIGTEHSNYLLDFADLDSAEAVIEVGPGLGALTRPLLKKALPKRFVEIDRGMCELLRSELPEIKELLIEADVLELSLVELAAELGVSKISVISNVPYSISSPFLIWLLRSAPSVSSASLLFQKEFAERIGASPSTKSYGSLTVLSDIFAEVSLGRTISGEAFFPKAGVESRVLKLRFREAPLVAYDKVDSFEIVLRAAFSKRRKTLLNCLGSHFSHIEKPQIAAAITSVGIDPSARGETLATSAFILLYEAMEKVGALNAR